MDPHLSNAAIYLAARIGDLLSLSSLERSSHFRTPIGDHVLHLSARFGHHPIIRPTINYKDAPHPLLFIKNYRGETPMHLAAEHGHISVVAEIAEGCAEAESDPKGHPIPLSLTDEIGEDCEVDDLLRPWRIQSRETGDTPLHKALRNGHEDVAAYLLGLDKEVLTFVNHFEESPLYLAAENKCDHIMEVILMLKVDRYSDSGPLGRNPLHAAIRTSRGAVACIIEKRPDLINKGDRKKRTPVHYAAEESHRKIVKILLKRDPDAACLHDKDGFTPLHRAAMAGSHTIMKAILKYSPHSMEFLDGKDGKTMLHLMNMKGSLLRKCLRKTVLCTLLNQPDHKGNTPLHSAIMELGEPKALALLSTKGVNWRIRNQNKQTPLDLCHSTDQEVCKKLHIVSLGLRTHEKAWLHKGAKKHKTVKHIDMLRERFRTYKEGELRHLINNMAFIATLIITLAFAAAFSVPGGYDSDTGDIILRHKLAFHVFFFSIIVALLTSIMVIINYPLGALFAKPDTLSKIAHDMAIQLHICLSVTAVSFICGVYCITSSNMVWIAVIATVGTMWCAGLPLLQNAFWAFRNRVLLKRVGYVARNMGH